MPQAITEESGVHKEWMTKAKAVKSLDDFTALYLELTEDYAHDYGTICHACASLAIAGLYLMERSPQGGITGFQAGAIAWEIIYGWGALVQDGVPARFIDYSNLLYPQYADRFTEVSRGTMDWAKKKAADMLEETGGKAHPDVVAHWRRLAAGEVPFGLRLAVD